MNRMFRLVKERFDIDGMEVFSDGAPSQFKNQYIFNALYHFLCKYALTKLMWHFFATSHGKDVVDGIGGAVKRSVWWQTLNRSKQFVHSLDDFCKVAEN